MPQLVALVTGASSGIGRATAMALAKDGYKVYAAARRTEQMKNVHEHIMPLKLDVTDTLSIDACVEAIIDHEGRIDVLVNNAGYGSYGSVEEVGSSEARHQFDVNVFGLAEMTQKVLPHMRAQASGTIINISSIGGKIAMPFGGWYHASKYAVEALSDSLRLELKPFGINVIIIEPGGIKTEWNSIATDSLLNVSDSGPYKKAATKAHASLRVDDKSPGPEVIGSLIVKALHSRNPRPRYHAGYLSSIVVYRRFIPDRIFDAILKRMIL
ncbi:SDR family NAD(P)-dependent oxidoreductase [Microbacteriaceae bacterium]|nr:SDR family NAD(P)-dependent oxidoreductase [Candidatus Saccharibacteria bacterium]